MEEKDPKTTETADISDSAESMSAAEAMESAPTLEATESVPTAETTETAEAVKSFAYSSQEEQQWIGTMLRGIETVIQGAEAAQKRIVEANVEGIHAAEKWMDSAQKAVVDYTSEIQEHGRHWEEELQRWQEGAKRWEEESRRRREKRAAAEGAQTAVTETEPAQALTAEAKPTQATHTELEATQATRTEPEITQATRTEQETTQEPPTEPEDIQPLTTESNTLQATAVEAEAVQEARQKALAAKRRAEAARKEARRRGEEARKAAQDAKKAERQAERHAERHAGKQGEKKIRASTENQEGIVTETLEERLEERVETVRTKMQGMSRWNYNALVALVPSVMAVLVFELVFWGVSHFFGVDAMRSPLVGLAMLIPMAMLMERFYFFLSNHEGKRIKKLSETIHEISEGNYQVELDTVKMVPYSEVAQDINDMSRKLSSVETLRRDFINDFSHEFKTPIVSISGFAHLLLDEDLPEEERNEYLQIIADESDRLATFSSNTLMMSRLDTQTEIPDPAPYALDAQIRQAVILLSRQWSEKQIEMDVDLSPLTYTGNADLMMHIWVNLLNNAIKFTPEGGTIRVRLTTEDGYAIASVQDTGCGMSEEDRQRIFQKYYQADTSHASKGMGLGLSIAWRIAQLAGGRIEVDSKLKEGSTFTVYLPL